MAIQNWTETTRPAGAAPKPDAGARATRRDATHAAHTGPRRPVEPEHGPDATEEPDSRVQDDDDDAAMVDDGAAITPRKIDLRTSVRTGVVAAGRGPKTDDALADEDDDEEEDAEDLVGSPPVPPRVPPRPRDPKPVFGA